MNDDYKVKLCFTNHGDAYWGLCRLRGIDDYEIRDVRDIPLEEVPQELREEFIAKRDGPRPPFVLRQKGAGYAIRRITV